jgi:hypothetical protein
MVGDSLIARGAAHEILLVPVAVGGARVAEWAPGGPYNHRMMYALDALQALGTVPTHILWHQGEADALDATTGDVYIARFRQLVESLRARGLSAPIYAATATYFGIPAGYAERQQVIRAAQRSLIDVGAGILPGPDTDLIRDRYDDCHMNEVGLRKHAAAWVDTLLS